MTPQGHRSFRLGLIALGLAAILALFFLLAARLGWIDVSEAQTRQIQSQGSSPYCLFAVNAYLTGQNMWDLESEYWRRNLPNPPTNATIFPLLSKAMTYPKQWNSDAVESQVQRQPVAVSGHGHAVVLMSWRNGMITYLDSLHSGQIRIMKDKEFWGWWDGWGWWVK